MLPMVHTEPVLFNFGGPNIDGAATPSVSVPPSLTPHSDDDLVNFLGVDVVDVAVDIFPRIDSCELQPGDTWRGMQGKMSVTAPVKKIRKKSDNKPQSQINKCNNEKRRRELENETINQLEELLGKCLADVKQPDKNGIVLAATKQIQEVLKRRRECPGECPLRAPPRLSPVQAGEVSSTQPQPMPPGHHYTETTTLIEALKHYTSSLGWVLLEINSKGEIVCVTENIKDFIRQDRTELYKKSIFSLLHVRDHAKLRPLLGTQSFSWSAGDADKFQAIQARLAIDNSNGTDDAEYVEAVIHAAPVRGSPAEQAGSVMCVIRRCEDASAALLPAPLLPDAGPPRTSAHTDQIVFRLDCSLNIQTCDLSGVNLVGTRYLDLVESGDRVRVATHLKGAPSLPAAPSISEPFRLRLGDRPLRVIAQTRLFRAEASSGEHDFIMSTHTVLDDEPEAARPAPPPQPNGDAFRAAISPGLLSLNDFEIDPWHFADMSDDSKETKDTASEGPATPRTPRTPATPADAPPPPQPADERLRSLLTKPNAVENNTDSNNRLLKVLLKQEDDEATSSETSAPHTPLTPHTPHTPHTPAALSPHHSAQAHRPHAPLNPHSAHPPHSLSMLSSLQPMHHNNSDILSRILNDKDEDAEENRRNCQDGGRGSSQPSALLTQLLSSSNGPSNNGRAQDSERDHYFQGNKRKFEESKGCSTSTVKRATPEIQQQVSSSAASSATTPSSATSPSTSGAGMSPLCQKNQILVSLLARQQTTPTTPLPMPNPALRPYAPRPRVPASLPPQPQPQRHHSALSNMLAHSRASNVNGGNTSTSTGMDCAPAMQSVQSHLQLVLQGGARNTYPQPAPNPPPSPLHYASYSASQPQSGCRVAGDSEVPGEGLSLSEILDEVIESMPDSDRSAPDVSVLLQLDSAHLKSDCAGIKEKNAKINAIRQSLMQCETVTKSPVATSPGPPPIYTVQNLGAVNMGGGSGALYSMSGSGVDPARARAADLRERARLLDMQRSQQMVVSREAAEQPQADLGSTMSALATGTPPNVALQRTDYHYIHPTNQMGSNYGTNKITSTQQNPMLSRQLSGSGGYAHVGHAVMGAHAALGAHATHEAHAGHAGLATHAPAALHTPLTQRAPPYHRAPRPHLVGGYYDEGGASAGYCGDYAHARRTPHAPHVPHAPHAPHAPHPPHPATHDQLACGGNSGGVSAAGAGAGGGAGAGAGGTSDYVREEIRAFVGARSARPALLPQHSQELDPLMTFDMPTPGGGGSLVGGRASSAPANSWESQQSTPNTTEAGSAEAASAASAGSAASAAGGDEAPMAGRAGAAGAGSAAASKASLLQKLLSQ